MNRLRQEMFRYGSMQLAGIVFQACSLRTGVSIRQPARRYADMFGVFLKHRDAVTRVTFRGLSDADSWLNRGRANNPLLWDRQRQPKPASTAVVEALRHAK